MPLYTRSGVVRFREAVEMDAVTAMGDPSMGRNSIFQNLGVWLALLTASYSARRIPDVTILIGVQGVVSQSTLELTRVLGMLLTGTKLGDQALTTMATVWCRK